MWDGQVILVEWVSVKGIDKVEELKTVLIHDLHEHIPIIKRNIY